jgi:hypothetical protein
MTAPGSDPALGHTLAVSYDRPTDRPPPTPEIVRRPNDPTSARTATFSFIDDRADVSFQCSIDGRVWQGCTTPFSYRQLGLGKHLFRVRALDRTAASSPGAQFAWHVTAQRTVKSFSISAGGLDGGPLYPGAPPQAIRVTLANPNGAPIFITSLTVTVPSGPAGCDSATNLSLAQSDVADAAPLEIPAHSSITLPAQGRSAPTIQLLNLPVNQDACQNARFPLNLTGSAHT